MHDLSVLVLLRSPFVQTRRIYVFTLFENGFDILDADCAW